MMKPDRLQVFLTPSWLIPKLGERSWNEKLVPSGVHDTVLIRHRAEGFEVLWAGSAAAALPVTNLMSDGNPQIEARVLGDHAAPLATAGPAQPCHTSDLVIPIRQHQVIPVGTRTPNTAEHLFLGDFPATHHWYLWGMGRYHTLWCTREDQHAGGLNHSRGLSSCPTHTHWWGTTWCWSTAGSPAEVPKRLFYNIISDSKYSNGMTDNLSLPSVHMKTCFLLLPLALTGWSCGPGAPSCCRPG